MSEAKDQRDRVFTIPNILTLFRIVLIPIFMVLYFRGEFIPSLVVVGLSALSDVLDGLIARKFHMVSALGKALDPIADKLSQFALMICLVTRFWHMIFPMILIFVKEITSGILGLVTMKKAGVLKGADWHGKVSTVLLYAMMMLHLLWYDIPPLVSDITIAVCCVMMTLSFILYLVRYRKILKAYHDGTLGQVVEREDQLPREEAPQDAEEQGAAEVLKHGE
ncbi:MAG: CDP-alcohol phosphatidyltransferase family protein [Lachnospiraceae bacterium]|nr:CDP-alcohol phosphatidyltransferase family protein [Lachnospiraceae bacterium]MBR5739325.1 CDP-alcohol phosphatidyltransferase family protein [Lachnospiraceae bacterium]